MTHATSASIVGVGIGRGAALGPVVRVRPISVTTTGAGPAEYPDASADRPVPADPPTDPSVAVAAVEGAFREVAADLEAQAAGALPTTADVLLATAAMARDPELIAAVVGRLPSGSPPTAAVDAAIEEFCRGFAVVGGRLAERVTDLRSVRDRVVARLQGRPYPETPVLDRPSIVVARDLAPADTAALDLDHVLGIVLEEGGPTSHTAIIARQLGLPCIVRAAGASTLRDGQLVAIDAAAGTVTVDPDDRVTAQITARADALAALAADRSAGATADGRPVQLLANIGTPADARRLRDVGVEGVGLFRTEVLFLGRASAPTHQEQVDAYADVLAALDGLKVVIRTLDAGADKPLPFVANGPEENPALGTRGFRLVRLGEELLLGQLDAIAGAARETGSAPWVMAPMVSTPREAAVFAGTARAVGIEHVGVMVEVPAAALRAADILAEVDFVSLGTNDLAQYTMATDRLRGELADLLDPWQPAVLDLVAATASAGVGAGKPVGVCGESAADPVMALVLVGMGVTSLSMAPAAVLDVRYSLSRHTLDQCRAIAQAAQASRDAIDARSAALELVDHDVRTALALT